MFDSIDNFLNLVYPSQDDEDIQAKLVSLKEFENFKAGVGEPIPGRQGLFSYQRFFKKFNDIFDRSFLIAEPGTGKSISFLSSAEHALDSGMFNKVIIIEPRKSLINEMKRQLAIKVAPYGKYAGDEKTKNFNRVVSKRLKGVYFFFTHSGFKKFVDGYGKNIGNMISFFSNSVIIVDEVHTLINSTAASPAVKSTKPDVIKVTDAYNSLFKVLRCSFKIKLILASATPMINSRYEIIPILNLLFLKGNEGGRISNVDNVPLYKINRSPLSKSQEFTEENFNTIIYPRISGFISYIRAEFSKIRVNYKGERVFEFTKDQQAISTIFDDESVRVEDKSESGIDAYITYFINNSKDPKRRPNVQYESFKNYNDSDSKDSFSIKGIHISSFVFPDGSYGGKVTSENNDDDFIEKEMEGMENYVERIVEKTQGSSYFSKSKVDKKTISEVFRFKTSISTKLYGSGVDSPSIPAFIGNKTIAERLDNLGLMSTKFKQIIKIETDALTKDEDGTTFIYTEKINGGGAILLGLCLELFGFERFDPNRYKNEDDYMSGDTKFYALVYGETPQSHIDTILEVFNNVENYKGSLIRIIIGTKTFREGINLKHVTRVHLVVAGWTASGITQAIARSLRVDSHHILAEKRKDDKLIEVDIYRHMTIFKDEDDVKVSVDYDIYEQILRKDLEIKNVLNFLKRAAVDCNFNRYRNIEYPFKDNGTIKDFSQECDYKKCDYKCGPQLSKDVIASDFGTLSEIYDNKSIAKHPSLYSSFINFYKDDLDKTHITSFEQLKTYEKFTNLKELVNKLYNDGMLNVYKMDKPVEYYQMFIKDFIKQRILFKDKFNRQCSIKFDKDSGYIYTCSDLNKCFSSQNNHYPTYFNKSYGLVNRNLNDSVTTLYTNFEDLSLSKLTTNVPSTKGTILKFLEKMIEIDGSRASDFIKSSFPKSFGVFSVEKVRNVFNIENAEQYILPEFKNEKTVIVNVENGNELYETSGESFGNADLKIKNITNYFRIFVPSLKSWRNVNIGLEKLFLEDLFSKNQFTFLESDSQVTEQHDFKTHLGIPLNKLEKVEIRNIYGFFDNINNKFNLGFADKEEMKSTGRNCETMNVVNLISYILLLDDFATASKIKKFLTGSIKIDEEDETLGNVSGFTSSTRVRSNPKKLNDEIDKLNTMYKDYDAVKKVKIFINKQMRQENKNSIAIYPKTSDEISALLNLGRNNCCIYIRYLLEYRQSNSLNIDIGEIKLDKPTTSLVTQVKTIKIPQKTETIKTRRPRTQPLPSIDSDDNVRETPGPASPIVTRDIPPLTDNIPFTRQRRVGLTDDDTILQAKPSIKPIRDSSVRRRRITSPIETIKPITDKLPKRDSALSIRKKLTSRF